MGTESVDTGSHARPLKTWLIVAMLLIVPVVGLSIIQFQTPHIERQAYANLSTIAELKGGQVESWMAERSGDALTLMNDQAFIEHVEKLQHTRGKSYEENHLAIQRHMQSLLKAYGYTSAMLLDPKGGQLLAVGGYDHIHEQIRALLPTAFASGKAQHCDLLYEYDMPHIDFVVPLMHKAEGRPLAVGAIVLRIDPRRFLFPFIQKWPAASQSGETLLARREGESVILLNKPRLQREDVLMPRISLASQNNPFVVAIREARPGTVAGLDYREKPVLTAYRPVVGTNWLIIAKLDRDEVMEPLRSLVFWVSLVSLIGIALLGAVLLGFWRQQQRIYDLVVQAEKTQSDRLLEQFFDLPFIGMAITSPVTKRWLRFNDKLCDILGYSREELAGKTWAELTYPEDLNSNLEDFKRMIGGQSEGFSAEKRYIRKDGAIVLVAINVECVRKSDGAVDYFCTTVQDITERKQIETALLESEARFRTIIEAIPVPLALNDEQGNITYLNKAFVQILGYGMHDIPTLSDWWKQACPDMHYRQEMADHWQQNIETAMRTRSAFKPMELKLNCQDGSMRIFMVSVAPLTESFHGAQLVVMVDITERKHAEESLRKLSLAVEQSPSSIVITDLAANIEYVNEGFVKTTGYSFAEAYGKNPRILHSGKNTRATYDDMWAHLVSGESWHGELINRRKDGREYIESVMISPVRQEDGRVTNYVAVKEDITKRKQAEMQLIEKLEELRRWHEVTMGREMRILELKREINELLEKLGEPPRYPSADGYVQ